jgi:hypothetical protein
MLLDAVQRMSDDGPLAGNERLTSVHPDWLTELYGERAGMEPGARRVATGPKDVQLDGIYLIDVKDKSGKELLTVRDGEFASFRPKKLTLPPNDPNSRYFVVRLFFDPKSGDQNGVISVSAGAVRLVTKGMVPGSSEPQMVDYYPIGTLDETKILYLQKPDDYLFLNSRDEKLKGSPGIDFVFNINCNGFLQGGKGALEKGGKVMITDGSFLEVKRTARFELGGTPVHTDPKELKFVPEIAVVRKDALLNSYKKPEDTTPADTSTPPTPAPSPAPAAAPAAAPSTPAAPAAPTTPSASAGQPSQLAKKLEGTWETRTGNSLLSMSFNGPEIKTYTRALQGSTSEEGTWKEVSSDGNSVTIHADVKNERTLPVKHDWVFTFEGDERVMRKNADNSGEPIMFNRK